MENKFDANSVIINILEGINELKSEVTDLQTKIDQLLATQKVSTDDTKFKESKVRASTPSLKKYTALQLINEIIAKDNLKAQVAIVCMHYYVIVVIIALTILNLMVLFH